MSNRMLYSLTSLGLASATAMVVACATAQQPDCPPTRDSSDVAEPARTQGAEQGHLPAALAQYFPPNTKAPVFLMEMFALEQPFTGIGIDLQEGDVEGARANYAAFSAQYTKLSKMIPEWQERYPAEPVEALGTALQSGDPAQVGPAMGRVGEVCASCHAETMIPSHQQFHWPRFAAVQVNDPVANNEPLTLHDYMMRLAGSYTGIANDLQQGQPDRARQHYQAFKSRFRQLAENGCNGCHDTPRTYYVDAQILQMVDRLGQLLQAQPPDPQAIQQTSMGIGMQSCMKCHLVHMPAALAQRRAAQQ